MKDRFPLVCAVFALSAFIVFLSFHAITGVFPSKLSGSDIWFHIRHSINPFFIEGRFYPPFFHLLVFALTPFTKNVWVSLDLVVSVVSFFCLPLMLRRLASLIFPGSENQAAFLFMFGSVPLLMIVWGTFPQMLALFFWGMMLIELFTFKGISRTFMFWAVLLTLTHSKGFELFALTVLAWGAVQSKWFSLSVLEWAGFAFLIAASNAGIPMFAVLDRWWTVPFYWINPIILYLLYWLWTRKEYKATVQTHFLDSLLVICLVTSPFDVAYRPLLYLAALLSIYAGKALSLQQDERRLRLLQLLWFAGLLTVIVLYVLLERLGYLY